MNSTTRKKLFDPVNQRLLYLDRVANQSFWDDKWEAAAKNTFQSPPRHQVTVGITKRYLGLGACILEGGCGLGDVVNALTKAGYQSEGVDYAPNVVAAINKNWPHLNVVQGDVRKLNVRDGYYDGYWSIGVIEHFPEGFDDVAHEMRRVLRGGGYLFLSFPSFNKFRRSRAATGKYLCAQSSVSTPPDFFQFALDPSEVIKSLEALDFELVEHRGMGSLQGLAEDLPLFHRFSCFLAKFHDRLVTAVSMLLDIFIGRYAGHSCLLIFRRTEF